MAVKTITIDIEAYALLSRHKREGQSFSQVIKAHFKPQPTAARVLERARRVRLSDDALAGMERVVRSRAKNPIRIPEL